MSELSGAGDMVFFFPGAEVRVRTCAGVTLTRRSHPALAGTEWRVVRATAEGELEASALTVPWLLQKQSGDGGAGEVLRWMGELLEQGGWFEWVQRIITWAHPASSPLADVQLNVQLAATKWQGWYVEPTTSGPVMGNVEDEAPESRAAAEWAKALQVPEYEGGVRCPGADCGVRWSWSWDVLARTITHLNDDHEWSFEGIAEWLRGEPRLNLVLREEEGGRV